ncbi:MAG: HAD family phosphatase [Lysobacter sp.]|nr:HAD family phosphatase [Lysobacter sp.]
MSPVDFVPEAVLFDMDGLMLDSERAIIDCWREAARDLAVVVDDDLWFRMIGMHEKDYVPLMLRTMDEAQVRALREACYLRYHQRIEDGIPLHAHVRDVLTDLQARAVPRAVVTSTQRLRADRKLATSGIADFFAIVVTGSDVTEPKPAPEGYLKAAAALGVDPACCVVFEDSAFGVRAALAAGMTPIQVPDLIEPDEVTRALGHRIVKDLAQAYALIR